MKLKDTLGATLLALADRRWTWSRLLRLQPEPTQRFGLVRVTVRALFGALLLGAIASLLLGLGLGETPPRWIFGYGFWAGLGCSVSWQTLTALAWNRRAARLADASVATGTSTCLPWWLRWLLGPVYVFVLGIALPLMLVVGVANVRAKRDWERYRAELVADGVKLTVAELLPGTVPDGENVAMAPFFAPVLLLFQDDQTMSEAQIVERHRKMQIPELPARTAKEGTKIFQQEPMDPAAVQRAFREAKTFSNEVAQADSAAGLVQTLRFADPQLVRLREALTRPRSRFPVRYDDTFYARIPHIVPIRSVGNVLSLRASALAKAGRGEEALVDTLAVIRLADVMDEEPLIISALVGFALRGEALKPVWEGLRERAWAEDQLRRLDAALARGSVEVTLRRAFQGDRALGTLGTLKIVEQLPMGPGVVDGPFASPMARHVSFLFYRNAIHLNHLWDAALGRKAGSVVFGDDVPEDRPYVLSAGWVGGDPGKQFARGIFPAIQSATNRMTRVLAEQRLARTAIALERFHLAKGAYPAALGELTPAYLAEALPDPYTGEAFRYERSADGRFRLWSLGINRRDDGGALGTKAYSKEAPATEPDDLCWAYQPVGAQ